MNVQNTTPEDAEGDMFDPAAALALSQAQTKRVALDESGPISLILASWAVAWGVGFLLVWAAAPGSPIPIPALFANVAFAVLTVAGIVISTIAGMKMNAGVRGSAAFSGTVYGLSWPLAMIGVFVIGTALFKAGLPPEAAWVYFPAMYGFVVGILYIVGAAIWQEKSQLIIGVGMLVIACGASLLGYPVNLLTMAILAGGGMGVAAAVVGVLGARSKRATRG
ncbi:MAG: hypothetical protein ACOH19_07670 [Rhodoglobus sp.]